MIGILGGTFDPIHFGHLRPALELLEELQFQEIRFMPSAVPPHRDQPQTSTDDRRAMVELAIAGQRGFVLETCEIERSGPSYMVDSLAFLRNSLGAQTPLVLILGMDAFVNLPLWHRWQGLTDYAHLLVTQRPGYAPVMETELEDWLGPRLVEDAQILRGKPGGNILFRQQVLLEISSTDIRERIGRGLSPRYLLPDAVCDYIRERGLYRP
jgi:nicotinate-nucleotide adenylyltransferase